MGSKDKFLLKVVSFNVRYDTPKDKDNRWDNRKELFIRTIKTLNPDILGLQEVLFNQLCFISTSLDDYDFVGVGREDGKQGGEFNPIFFRKGLLNKLKEGHFWLSETPNLPGSKSWGASLPRIASWVRLEVQSLEVRNSERNNPFYVINTHLSHKSEEARIRAAELLKTFISKLDKNSYVVLMGDFNTAPESKTYKIFVEANLYDTFRVCRESEEKSGTSHGFTGVPNSPRIDWILVSKNIKPLSFEVYRYSENGVYPSDHFPIVSLLNFE